MHVMWKVNLKNNYIYVASYTCRCNNNIIILYVLCRDIDNIKKYNIY